VKVTVNRSFSILKFSRRIHAISVLRFPDNLSKDRIATALNRKYSLGIVLAFFSALLNSPSSMAVSRLSLKELFLTRVKKTPPRLLFQNKLQKLRRYIKRCSFQLKEKEGKLFAGDKICWQLENEVLLQTLTT
jgi:hypothetical protein